MGIYKDLRILLSKGKECGKRKRKLPQRGPRLLRKPFKPYDVGLTRFIDSGLRAQTFDVVVRWLNFSHRS